MSKKMLIDASHEEETRVAILNEEGNLQDYEFKSSTKDTVKGNIYLAKIARVEPSLQAAFVDYGGNRHGFLAFSEIHPDYFRIPVSDREAFEEAPAEEIRIEVEEDAASGSGASPADKSHPKGAGDDADADDVDASASSIEPLDGNDAPDDGDVFQMPVSTIGGDLPPSEDDDDDEDADLRRKGPPLHRRYKIQEVIHKNQIILVQVAKEERGGKGAALTTFLSLAGRYCVLMPNSPRSGGVSRKISNLNDRKRLREILDSFDIPGGMGLIVRTAGKDRTRLELRRDAQYLMRLWDDIRNLTLKSVAPALINREDNIIKRAIRDLYTKEITEVIVEGEEGYKLAKDFMKTLMPSHSKRVQRFKMEGQPLFHQFGVESQIDDMHNPEVRLPSGGSIVIHPTEALVSIDINSGKATKERHIEKTATKTNLEAAVEIARQIKLRDLAGLIVIDFIDMEEPRNVSAVEKKIREAFRTDRARIQLGRISPFGLLEMSRQRLAPSILERSAHPCPHCQATGFVRSTESFALHVVRLLEEEGHKKQSRAVRVEAPSDVIFYLMNFKRKVLADIEARHELEVTFEASKSPVQTCVLTRLDLLDSSVSGEKSTSQGEATHPAREKRGTDTEDDKRKSAPKGRGKNNASSPKATEKSSGRQDETLSKEQEDTPKKNNAEISVADTAASDADEGTQRKRRSRRRPRRQRRPQDEEAAAAASLTDSDAQADGQTGESSKNPEAQPAKGHEEGGENGVAAEAPDTQGSAGQEGDTAPKGPTRRSHRNRGPRRSGLRGRQGSSGASTGADSGSRDTEGSQEGAKNQEATLPRVAQTPKPVTSDSKESAEAPEKKSEGDRVKAPSGKGKGDNTDKTDKEKPNWWRRLLD